MTVKKSAVSLIKRALFVAMSAGIGILVSQYWIKSECMEKSKLAVEELRTNPSRNKSLNVSDVDELEHRADRCWFDLEDIGTSKAELGELIDTFALRYVKRRVGQLRQMESYEPAKSLPVDWDIFYVLHSNLAQEEFGEMLTLLQENGGYSLEDTGATESELLSLLQKEDVLKATYALGVLRENGTKGDLCKLSSNLQTLDQLEKWALKAEIKPTEFNSSESELLAIERQIYIAFLKINLATLRNWKKYPPIIEDGVRYTDDDVFEAEFYLDKVLHPRETNPITPTEIGTTATELRKLNQELAMDQFTSVVEALRNGFNPSRRSLVLHVQSLLEKGLVTHAELGTTETEALILFKNYIKQTTGTKK